MPIYVTPRNLENSAPCTSTNGFTIGRRYTARLNHNGRLIVAANDNGHDRYIGLDGDGGAHLQRVIYSGEAITAGRFEIERE